MAQEPPQQCREKLRKKPPKCHACLAKGAEPERGIKYLGDEIRSYWQLVVLNQQGSREVEPKRWFSFQNEL